MVTVASCRRQAFHCDFFPLCLWVSCSLVFSPSFNPPVPSLYVFFSCSTFDFWSVNSSIFHSFHVLLSNLFDYFIVHEAIKFWCGFLWRHSTWKIQIQTGVKKKIGYTLKASTKIPGVKFHVGLKDGRENTRKFSTATSSPFVFKFPVVLSFHLRFNPPVPSLYVFFFL